jgi:hypothetical protein
MDGFYAMYFTGAMGSGNGVLVLREGVIAGADSAGGTYDGKYVAIDDGRFLEGSVTLKIPAGATLVTGAAAGSIPQSFEIPLRIPSNLGGERPLPISTPTGPVNIIFKRLRGL